MAHSVVFGACPMAFAAICCGSYFSHSLIPHVGATRAHMPMMNVFLYTRHYKNQHYHIIWQTKNTAHKLTHNLSFACRLLCCGLWCREPCVRTPATFITAVLLLLFLLINATRGGGGWPCVFRGRPSAQQLYGKSAHTLDWRRLATQQRDAGTTTTTRTGCVCARARETR